MEIRICKDPKALGASAAAYVAEAINAVIAKNGSARIALSTGASQFDTLKALPQENVDWTKVEMFHLDEYVDLPNCVKMATQTPARMMGLTNVGKLEAGFDADIVLFDEDINVSTVIVKNGDDVCIHNN